MIHFPKQSQEDKILTNIKMNTNNLNETSQDTTNMYQPLVEYTQNKEFAGLMETLFGAVEKLQERALINEGDYLDLANLTKKLYEAKTQIQQSVVYVEIVRRAKKEPPKPPKAVEKLNDKNFRTCEFCNKRLHCKFIREHQRTTRSCILQQQARRNIKTEKYEVKDDRHTRRQAFAVQLIARYKSGVIQNNRLGEDNIHYISNDRIMGVITPPPYVKIDEKTGEEKTVYPSKENHTQANMRMWNECRPDVAPTYEPYPLCSDEIETPPLKVGGGAVKESGDVLAEIRAEYEPKSNKELLAICVGKGIKAKKTWRKEDYINAIFTHTITQKKKPLIIEDEDE